MNVEPHRPVLHFAPRAGWINDPNGLIYLDGVWHAFFQHDPDSIEHGPMHWGHAASVDLVHWTEQPVALYPDALGTCFSGCAIETHDGDVKIFYTAHRKTADGSDFQTQCLVHANRAMTEFVSDAANPIIPNPGLRAFRDPKVLWHAETGRWIMVLTHGQCIGFYSSDDLMHWQAESTFGVDDGRHSSGPWECPDLIRMRAPDGSDLWALIVGIGTGAFADGSGTQYFLGRFDGRTFENINPPDTTLWLDYGRDYYAAQSFFGVTGAPVIVAWASNWAYARHTPTSGFRGVLSLPRELALVETETGIRICASAPDAVIGRFDQYDFVDTPTVPRTGTYRLSGKLVLAPDCRIGIALFGESTPQFTLSRKGAGNIELGLERASGRVGDAFAHSYSITTDALEAVDVEIFVDNGLVEFVAQKGALWATSVFYPEQPSGPFALVSSKQ